MSSSRRFFLLGALIGLGLIPPAGAAGAADGLPADAANQAGSGEVIRVRRGGRARLLR